MILLPPALRVALPALYTQEKVEDPIVHLKFFTPWTSWTWFVTEGEQQKDTFMFFGHIIGQEEELGYFTLEELESINGPAGLKIEHDLHFKPGPMSEALKTFRGK